MVRPLALLLLFTPITFAYDINDPMKNAFGDGFAAQKKVLDDNRYSLAPGQSPEERVHPGDVIVYIDLPENVAAQARSDVMPPLPDVYHRALQGFRHAAIVGNDDQGKLFHLEAPQGICSHDFRGQWPYVVLRPKAAIRNKANFGRNMDTLIKKFSQINFEYDMQYDTEILGMSSQARVQLQSDIMSYDPKEKGPKPHIPDLYCSELVTTLYRMMGVTPTKVVEAQNLFRIGLAKDVASGKPKEQIAQDSVQSILDVFGKNLRNDHDRYVNELAAGNLNPADAAKKRLDVQKSEAMISGLTSFRPTLYELVRHELGLCPSAALQKSKLASLLAPLAFYFKDRGPVVRPIDLVREADGGNFELAGYYDGSLPATCDQNKTKQN